MNINIPSPPRTIMEVFKMLPEGTLAELINGQIFMSPAPSILHQRISGKLERLLASFIEKHSLGEILHAPLDIFLDNHKNAVQPDIIFISKDNPSQPLDQVPYHGTPDLLVEILSPSNDDHDLITKKELYEKFGVKEYWIVDSVTKEVIVYQLQGGSYSLAGREFAKISSPLLKHVFEF